MTNTAINLLVDPIAYRDDTEDCLRLPLINLFKLIGDLGYHAMMLEVHLTPKPGLVDANNNGAHDDMDINTFERSAEAIRPFLTQFLYAGWQHSSESADSLLTVLRPVGIEAEKAMFEATKGVNTHKGMIFSLGLVCGAVGWLRGKQLAFDAMHISQTIKRCCEHLVIEELRQSSKKPETYGESLYQKFGLTGARGEAASGLATVIDYGLPAYEETIAQGYSTEQALWQSLLVLMANNDDTNLVSRGGMEGLLFARRSAGQLLEQGGCGNLKLEQALTELDKKFTARRLSPGGSADLLAISWLMAQLNELNGKQSKLQND